MFEPSAQIRSLIATVALRRAASSGMRAMMERESEFPSVLQAKLTGIALDPNGRDLADDVLDTHWSDEARQRDVLASSSPDREVIIGSGFHAAVYAAIRVQRGYPKPLVLERHERAGGTFAMTARPTFYLNSRNRAGNGGLAGDQGSSLNYLPGAPIQAANVSMVEYQTNTDMAFVIRLALAQAADVIPTAKVLSVSGHGPGMEIEIEIENHGRLLAGRVIDARGLGDPSDQKVANGETILTFGQFMQRMARRWPLRGVRRAAVIGGGDSAKCAVESLLGIAPQPSMAAAALDTVGRIDWYSTRLPTTCERWQQDVRGRYQALGRYLRPDRLGARRLTVVGRRAQPIALPGMGLIGGRTYDLVVLCTGNQETPIDGLDLGSFYDLEPRASSRPNRVPTGRLGRRPQPAHRRQSGGDEEGALLWPRKPKTNARRFSPRSPRISTNGWPGSRPTRSNG
jgi:hypothetical protein